MVIQLIHLPQKLSATCPEIWISVGTGQTAFNFYVPGPNGDAIIIGVYQNEEVWTDIVGLGPEISDKLALELAKIGIDLDTGKQWCFWKRDGVNLNLKNTDPVKIAKAVKSISILYSS